MRVRPLIAALASSALLSACVRPLAGPGSLGTTLEAASSGGILASQVAPPSTINMALVLAGTESKGLQKTAAVALPTAVGDAIPGQVLIHFKDGQVHAVPGARLIRALPLPGTGVFETTTGSGFSVQAVSAWMQDPQVAYAEPDYVLKAMGAPAGPSDPDMNQSWGYYQIHADQTWDAGYRASSSVIVGVVDTGVDYTHPDLSGVVIKGPNLVAGTDDPMDDDDHGTHVAGVIGAVADNGQGIAGVAAGARIYAVKVLDSTGAGAEDVVAQGVVDAVNAGAKVVNLSLGGPDDVLTLHQALQYAQEHGALCVVAAGNDGGEGPSYPASYPEALAVGATGADDSRAYFSNDGSYVAIAAPGVQILSTVPGDQYQMMDGTSMAAPYVSAAAAVLWSADPSLTAQQVRDLLVSTADPTTGFDHGKVGRLDLQAALSTLTGKTIGTPDIGPNLGNPPLTDPASGPDAPPISDPVLGAPTPMQSTDPEPASSPAPSVGPTTSPLLPGWGSGDSTPTWGSSGGTTPTWGQIGQGTDSTPVWGGSSESTPTWGGSADSTPTWGGSGDSTPTWGGSGDSTPTWGSSGNTVPTGQDQLPTFGQDPVPTGAQTVGTSPWTEAMATAFQIAPEPANVAAFVSELGSYQHDGTLGPGTSQAAAVRDLQRALTHLGYACAVTGEFDAATSQAVEAYKRANQIHQSYRDASGAWAVNPYVPPGMFDLLMAQLAGATR